MTKRTQLRSRLRSRRSMTLADAIPLSNWHFDRYYANNRYYGGVHSRDSIPKRIGAKFYIINLDDSTGPGTLWVALYNVGRKPIYFDSFGVWPPKELMKIKNLVFNDYRIQSRNSRSCGLYCIYVCDQLLAGREFIDILLDFSPSDCMLNETKILNEMNEPLAGEALAVDKIDLGAKAPKDAKAPNAAVGLGERSSPHGN